MPSCPAWALTTAEVLKHHGVADVAKGLKSSEVEARRAVAGFNELHKAPGTPMWKLILEQFDDTLVKASAEPPPPPPPPAAAACHHPPRSSRTASR